MVKHDESSDGGGEVTPEERNAVQHLRRWRENGQRTCEALSSEFGNWGERAAGGSLQRTIKGERRIRFGEAIALARMMGVDVGALADPPEIRERAEARRLLDEWQAREAEERAAGDAATRALEALAEFVREIPSYEPARAVVSDWVRQQPGIQNSEGVEGLWMYLLTGDEAKYPEGMALAVGDLRRSLKVGIGRLKDLNTRRANPGEGKQGG